jgi:DNA polymerase V
MAARAQQELLHKILELSRNGHRPTVSEMTQAMRASADSNTVRLLDELERKRYIDRYKIGSRVQPRGTTLTERALKWLDLNGADTSSYGHPQFVDDGHMRLVPLYGPVKAGNEVSVENRAVGRVPLPAQDIPIGRVWVQAVQGDSMTGEDGILEGDQIVVVPYPDPRGEGEMVVATVQGGETVKRLWREGDSWVLHPSNPAYNVITLQETDSIAGRVVGVLRWHIRPGRRYGS